MFRQGEPECDNRVYDANSGNNSRPTVEQIFAIRRSIIYLSDGDMKEKVHRGLRAAGLVNNEVRIEGTTRRRRRMRVVRGGRGGGGGEGERPDE